MSPIYQRLKTQPDVKEVFEKRSLIVRALREWFWDNSFIETETPLLVNLPSMEPYLDPFKTELKTESGKSYPAYLITSPEFAMKQLLAGGMERIFQITRSFRNCETLSKAHNPEFTILEWYRAYSDYEAIMRDTEEICAHACQTVNGSTILSYQGQTIDLTPPWERISFADALKRYAKLDYDQIDTKEKLIPIMQERGYSHSESDDWDSLILQVFINEVEQHLGQKKPTILCDYPASQAALATISPNDPRFAQRFEAYIAGVELCNAFDELTNWQEQQSRLEEDRALRIKLGKDDYGLDLSFIEALRFGMPKSGGNALGVDRLCMILLDKTALRDVIYIPWTEMFLR